jgi:hypothetical protein
VEEVVPGQEAVNFELGAKTDWLDHRLRVNGSVFYEDYKSYLNLELATQCSAATSLNPGNPYFLAGGLCPAGTALAGTPGLTPWFYYAGIPAYEPGAELHIDAAPIDRLLINFEGGWLEFHAKNSNMTAATPGYINPSVRLQPEWNASGGIQYGILLPGATLTPRLDWRYQGYQTNGPENVYQISEWRLPGYSLFNARLTYAPTGVRFARAPMAPSGLACPAAAWGAGKMESSGNSAAATACPVILSNVSIWRRMERFGLAPLAADSTVSRTASLPPSPRFRASRMTTSAILKTTAWAFFGSVRRAASCASARMNSQRART